MSDFSQEIQNFQRYGTYTYKFDNVGNMIFDSSSINFNQVYVAFPLQNLVYDNSKIKTMYNVEFEEFVPKNSLDQTKNSDTLQQLSDIQQENEILKNQLDSLVSQNTSTIAVSNSNQLAIKQVILELRKTIGQGRVDSDFSDTFPYTPIIKTNI